MPVIWTPEKDQALFIQLLAVLDQKPSEKQFQAVAERLGPECTGSGVRYVYLILSSGFIEPLRPSISPNSKIIPLLINTQNRIQANLNHSQHFHNVRRRVLAGESGPASSPGTSGANGTNGTNGGAKPTPPKGHKRKADAGAGSADKGPSDKSSADNEDGSPSARKKAKTGSHNQSSTRRENHEDDEDHDGNGNGDASGVSRPKGFMSRPSNILSRYD
jgi:hypothetical protein